MAAVVSKTSRGRPLEEYSEGRLLLLKVALSVAIFFVSFSTGLFSALTGPTLPDLRVRYDSTVEGMSTSLGLKNIGYLITSLISGIVNDRFLDKASLTMALALLVAAVCTLLVPWGRQLWVLGLLCFVQGLGHGLSGPPSVATTTTLWGKKSATPLHAVLFGWPLGQVIAPLICAPFISERAAPAPPDCANHTLPTACPETSTPAPSPEAPIEIPFLISAIISFLTAVAFIILYFFIPREMLTQQKKPKKSAKDMFNPASCSNGRPLYGTILVLLFTLYVIFNSGIGRMNNLFFSYLLDSSLGFSSSEAVLFTFAMNLSATCSRVLVMFVVLRLRIQVVTCVEVLGTLASALCMLLLGVRNKTLLWVFTMACQVFTGPMYPGQYAWIDRYIIVYSVVVSVAMTGMGLLGYFFEWLNGYLYTNVSRDGILYSKVGCAGACAVLFVIMQILASCHGERERVQEEEEETVAAPSSSDGPPSYCAAVAQSNTIPCQTEHLPEAPHITKF